MLRRIVTLLFLLVLAIMAAALGGFFKLRQWSGVDHELTGEQIVELPGGTSLARFAASLEAAGVIDSAPMFQAWVRINGSYRKFQAGKYRFTGALSPEQVVAKIVKGDIFVPVILSITIPEGFQQRQVVDRLAAHQIGTPAELRALTIDKRFLESLALRSATSLEGYLYPATYPFTEQPSARQALERMVKKFYTMLPKDYEAQVGAKGLTLHQAVIFASLIELETLHDDERPLVSEVIWRRLKDNMPLGIDAAVIYGITDYAGDLRSIHLVDAKNPYNLRIHRGLPPSPIGSPSAKSLAAVLTPTDHGYYYYVLSPNSNRHQFSRTLKEHNEHVRKLVNAIKRDRRGDKGKD